MTLIPNLNSVATAHVYRSAGAAYRGSFTRRVAVLGVVALFGALAVGEAGAVARTGGPIPPNANAKSSASTAAKQTARPTTQPAAKPTPAPAAISAAKAVARDVASAAGQAAAKAAPAHLAARSPAPSAAAAKPASSAPNTRSGLMRITHGLSYIPPNPSSQAVKAPAPEARPTAPAASAPPPSSPAPRAAEAPKQPDPTPSSAAASSASMSSAAPAAKAAPNTAALDKPVKTEYIKGSDGHEITINYFRNPDGSLYKTAVSPAAFPPPNASAAQSAPSRAQQRVPDDTAKPAASGPVSSTFAVAGSAPARSGEQTTAAPVQVAYAPSSAWRSAPSNKPVESTRLDRGVIPPSTSVPARSETPQTITVMVPDSTAAPPNPATLALPAPRQGMDVIDRSIGEFDASWPAASTPTNVPRTGSSNSASSPAPRASTPLYSSTRRTESGADGDAGQAQAYDRGARIESQSAGDDQAASPNRRSRQARSAGSRMTSATRLEPAQPLVFGRVTRASFTLARMQAPATATRGVRLAPTPRTVAPIMRPGEISGRGIAQVADLGRGSPTYGAAPEVFADAAEPSKTPVLACKARSAARHLAQRQGGKSRATNCA